MAHFARTQSIKFGDHNENCGNTIGSYNTTVYKSDQDAQILRWLSPIEPNTRHQGVRDDRFDGVGDWILEASEFREWEGVRVKPIDQMFCSGGPGVEKAYLR